MDKMKGIYWLASYPKSGNTWFRIVLSNLLSKTQDRVNLDNINTGAIASSRAWIDDILGFDSAMLSHDELDQLLPSVFKYEHERMSCVSYHKIHNAFTFLDKTKKKPLIPVDGCLGAIYIVRNPLDVCISFANHSSCSIDQAIDTMSNPDNAFCDTGFGQASQVRHLLGSWSTHVQSWAKAQGMNVLLIRYEDMKITPMETFAKAIEFLKIEASQEELALAIENAKIEKLQHLESQSGFKERPAKVERFFRKGIIGDWESKLTSAQIRRIVRDHAIVMQEHGYLNESLIDFF